jgi:hypothetical protein
MLAAILLRQPRPKAKQPTTDTLPTLPSTE